MPRTSHGAVAGSSRGAGLIGHGRSASFAGIVLLIALSGCGKIQELLGGGEKAAAAAEAKLKAGDIPGAADGYGEAAKKSATAVSVATGAAYTALLAGDADGADKLLAGAEAKAGEKLGEIKMRRALVALHEGDLDNVRAHAEASGLAVGKLLAAEVALADGERDEAKGLLTAVSGEAGAVGDTASQYLSLIDDADPSVAGLSEAQALWALGARKVAVKSAEDLVKGLPDSRTDREELLLIWAGRAASVQEPEVARSLLESAIFPPEGQAWRKVATLGVIAAAEGNGAEAVKLLGQLEGTAPADGLADAKATAAFLLAKTDAESAKALASPYSSNAAARALEEAGDLEGAKNSSVEGVYASYLKSGG